MRRYLIRGSNFRALAIAANSPEYGFCFDLMPSVDGKVSILGSRLELGDSANAHQHRSSLNYL